MMELYDPAGVFTSSGAGGMVVMLPEPFTAAEGEDKLLEAMASALTDAGAGAAAQAMQGMVKNAAGRHVEVITMTNDRYWDAETGILIVVCTIMYRFGKILADLGG